MTHVKHRTWANVKPRKPLKRYNMDNNTGYDYKIISLISLDEITKNLDTLSNEGWELVSVVEDRHYFKRSKSFDVKSGRKVL